MKMSCRKTRRGTARMPCPNSTTSSGSARRTCGTSIRSRRIPCRLNFPTAGSIPSPTDQGKLEPDPMHDDPSHDHDHDHPHEHPPAPMVEEITDFEVLEIAVRELAIEKGLFTADDHRRFTEWAEQIGPAGGSRLVAKAWSVPALKQRVLDDAVAACREIGIDWSEPTGSGTPSDYMNLR